MVIPGRPIRTDPTEQRAGKIGKQRIEDAAHSIPNGWRPWTTEVLEYSLKFLDKAKRRQAVLPWLNPTRMHVVTHLFGRITEAAHPGERLVVSRSRMAA